MPKPPKPPKQSEQTTTNPLFARSVNSLAETGNRVLDAAGKKINNNPEVPSGLKNLGEGILHTARGVLNNPITRGAVGKIAGKIAKTARDNGVSDADIQRATENFTQGVEKAGKKAILEINQYKQPPNQQKPGKLRRTSGQRFGNSAIIKKKADKAEADKDKDKVEEEAEEDQVILEEKTGPDTDEKTGKKAMQLSKDNAIKRAEIVNDKFNAAASKAQEEGIASFNKTGNAKKHTPEFAKALKDLQNAQNEKDAAELTRRSVETQPDTEADASATDDNDPDTLDTDDKAPAIDQVKKQTFLGKGKDAFKKLGSSFVDAMTAKDETLVQASEYSKQKKDKQNAANEAANANYSRKKWNATISNDPKFIEKVKEINSNKHISATQDTVLDEIITKRNEALNKFQTLSGEAQSATDFNSEIKDFVEFKEKLMFYMCIFFIVFVVMYFGVFITNILFYPSIFDEEKEGTDFSSFDGDFKEKYIRLLLYILACYGGCIISFLLILAILYVFIAIGHLYNLKEYHVKSVIFQKAGRTLKNIFVMKGVSDKVYIWLVIAIVVPLIFFLVYAPLNKTFVTQMQFSELIKQNDSEDDDNNEDISPLPQQKLFLWHYILATLVVFALGIVFINMEESSINLIKSFGFVQAILVICMSIIYMTKNQTKNKAFIGLTAMSLFLAAGYGFLYLSPYYPKTKSIGMIVTAIVVAGILLGVNMRRG